MSAGDPPDERVIYRNRFQGAYFDFRGKSIFTRYDRREFVKCTLLIDHSTEQLAFTACVFKDCNIYKLHPDEARGLHVTDNFFDRPLDESISRSGWPKLSPRGRRRMQTVMAERSIGFLRVGVRAISGQGTISSMSKRLVSLIRRILMFRVVARSRAAGSILASRSKSAAISGA